MTVVDVAPKTRQELYDQIRESSLEEVIFQEMVRYGFWPEDQPFPEDPEEEVTRKAELNKELSEIRAKFARLHDIEALVRAARKKRMEESKVRQKETKERRLKERQDKAKAWQKRKTKEINYLGEGVSGSLSQYEAETKRLKKQGLPNFKDAAALAKAMDITVNELRFLAFSRKTSPVHHYNRFYIAKKSGGQRLISAPMGRLKKAQNWILENILNKVELHDAAHGFVPERSIVTNAEPHVGADIVVNVDLQNFFPTLTYRRVWGCFKALGYSPALSSIFSLLCTESEVQEVEIDGRTWFIRQGERFLPQGAPSSPALTNIICRRTDKRVTGLAEKLGFTYTRYADDMTFSAEKGAKPGNLLNALRSILHQEGFTIHPDKTRIFHKGRRQEVTGIVVNEKLNINRKTLKRFRATLFQIEKDGPEGKEWGNGGDLLDAIHGYANFVNMVNPEKGAPLVERVNDIIRQYR